MSDSLDAMVHPVRIGVKLSPQNKTIASLRTFWRLADETGFDHLWVYDHLAAVVPPWAPDAQVADLEDVFESWTLLAAMASETSRIRIGCLVTATTFRHRARKNGRDCGSPVWRATGIRARGRVEPA